MSCVQFVESAFYALQPAVLRAISAFYAPQPAVLRPLIQPVLPSSSAQSEAVNGDAGSVDGASDQAASADY